MGKYVWFFGGKKTEGSAKMVEILGNKGAQLAEMAKIGVPVPPGFTISTEACREYLKSGRRFPEGLEDEIRLNIKALEEFTKKTLGGDGGFPLLVSVRSGAPVSMPGMMDTILNLGLNQKNLETLKRINPRFAYDTWRRFIQMFSSIALGLPREGFEKILSKWKVAYDLVREGKSPKVEEAFKDASKMEPEEFARREKKVKDTDLPVDVLALVAEHFLLDINEKWGEFPQDPWVQLKMAIEAVFNSWNNPRAREYRMINRIPDDVGTAVNVVTMVFGNIDEKSGTGVIFTRNPGTGERKIYGDFLPNAQGEDVVAGIRTPHAVNIHSKHEANKEQLTLEELMPDIYEQLEDIALRLERHYKDMQDIEFTIESGKLQILQTRTGKRTPQATIKIAVDMSHERLIPKKEALRRVKPDDVEKLLYPRISPDFKGETIARGLPASPGAVTGKVVFNPDVAAKKAEVGEKVILVRHETSPDDIKGMARAVGILTSRGGMTSHAAVVARGMGKPAVVGAESIIVDYNDGCFRIGELKVEENEFITIDGTTGNIFLGDVPKEEPEFSDELRELLIWADKIRKIGVRANADRPHDAKIAKDFGAEGIGLLRTEHMFFEGERIYTMREMIISAWKSLRDSKEEAKYKKSLVKIKEWIKGDFKEIFKVMEGYPVTVRLLDPPLHEFLPRTKREIEETSEKLGLTEHELEKIVETLSEANPMLGHRGVRVGVTYPDIYKMQSEAILEAEAELIREGRDIRVEIMIPNIIDPRELSIMRTMIEDIKDSIEAKYGVKIPLVIGTMIEFPRACALADEIAQYAEFFSFGTNDLTQTVFGFSRDDVGKFLHFYVDKGILKCDPFQSLDISGVGEFIKLAVNKGRRFKKKLKIGICGEHGGDPTSIVFFHHVGLDYVSCSPFRIPVARLTAAKAQLEKPRKK